MSVDISGELVEARAREIRTLNERIHELMEEMTAQLHNLHNIWVTPSGEEFLAEYKENEEISENFYQRINSYADFLDGVSALYEELDHKLISRNEDAFL